MTIPEYLLKKIDYVIAYVDGNSNDWFRIKMELINAFPLQDRKRFSRRHKTTKKQFVNEFDKKVIDYWERKTGTRLWVDPEKLHPKDWVDKPRGWRLVEINKERKERQKRGENYFLNRSRRKKNKL